MRGFTFLLLLLVQSASASYLFVEGRFESHKNWLSFSSKEALSVKNLLMQLKKSPTGKVLIQKAKEKAAAQGESLLDVIKAGNGSLTDTTLVRRFSKGDADSIQYQSRSLVYLNRSLTQYDALMDLAHELTHFVFRKDFNPYTKNFTLAQFISSTIEGKGGEVQAFMMECRVHYELFRNKSPRGNCHNVHDEKSGKFSRSLTVRQFYQLGNYYDSFIAMLRKYDIEGEFPLVTDNKASFVSSAYGIPYPVAAFEEYLSVLSKVCANDRKRLGYLQQRSPASASFIRQEFEHRCGDFKQ